MESLIGYGHKFVELDQFLDTVSTGPRWLERLAILGKRLL
jgi:hypothetical protein